MNKNECGFYQKMEQDHILKRKKFVQLKAAQIALPTNPLNGLFIDIKRDGNCVFHAFIQSLGLTEDSTDFRSCYISWLSNSTSMDKDTLYMMRFNDYYMIDEDIENLCRIFNLQLVLCKKDQTPIEIKYPKYNENYIYWIQGECHYDVIYLNPPNESKLLAVNFFFTPLMTIKATRVLSRKKCSLCKKELTGDKEYKLHHYSQCRNNKCPICSQSINAMSENDKEKHLNMCVLNFF
jgi:hypothetical protein